MPERFFDALVIQHFLEEFSFNVFLGRYMRLMAVFSLRFTAIPSCDLPKQLDRFFADLNQTLVEFGEKSI